MKKFLIIMLLLMSFILSAEIPGRPDIRPLKNSNVLSIAGTYGDKRSMEGSVYYHQGIDYVCYLDTPVYATGDGEVVLARYLGEYGNCVVVKHNWTKNGKAYTAYSYYAHLIEFKVLAGQTVSKRQLIGLAGNTGRAQGTHVHYELRDENSQHIWNGKYQRESKLE